VTTTWGQTGNRKWIPGIRHIDLFSSSEDLMKDSINKNFRTVEEVIDAKKPVRRINTPTGRMM